MFSTSTSSSSSIILFLFTSCHSVFSTIARSKWDTSRVTNMESMFGAAEKFDGNLSTWITTEITSLKSTFSGAKAFSGKGLDTWLTSKVTDFYQTFANTKKCTADLSNWDLSKATITNRMFEYSDFNGDLSKWNTKSNKDMGWMFANTHFFNSDVSIKNRLMYFVIMFCWYHHLLILLKNI